MQVLQGNSSQLTRAVCEHTADFCITSFREGDFDWIPLYADPMVAWLPPEHPLAGGRTFPLAAFATEPTIATYMHQDTDNARVFARAASRRTSATRLWTAAPPLPWCRPVSA